MLNSLNKIKIETPVDQVVSQLRSLITNGDLRPGDVLPSERKLSEKLGVGRLTIRDAIKKLEFYGIVKTHPQSGTVVKGKGILALEGLIIDILDFEEVDFESIVDIRNLLEIKSAGLAAIKRTQEDITLINEALEAYENKIKNGEPAEEEDLQLHLQIAEVSGNSVLKLLMRIISPDIIKNFNAQNANNDNRNNDVLKEHQEIVNQIIARDAKEAKNAMRIHLRGSLKSDETNP